LTTEKAYVRKLAAKVFYAKKTGPNKAHIKIAYPSGLFELDNIPNFLSSVAGNIFGLRDLKNLKLIDMHFPQKMLAKFKGPMHGIEGIRKLMKIKSRPLVGTIIKPKLGLVTKDHANVAFNAWLGGCDIVKDDENLSSQSFNSFEERLKQTVKMKERAEKITGEKKVYMINVTAETEEMLRRARLAKKYGNEYLMVDVLTVGWSALQTLRKENQDLKLVMHAHRAGHAAFTKGDNGISMNVIAKLVRLIGVDQLHIGTIVGKMGESEEEVLANRSACVDKMGSLKKVFPVCSGGLQPGDVPALMKYFGKDVIIQMGGGIHGHPNGTIAGAKAARQAVNAVLAGKSLEQYSKNHSELKIALEKWARK
jgi:ribulose-bisphosphate carboxylase large chain